MTAKRMLVLLAVVLAIGTVIASRHGSPSLGLAVAVTAILGLAAAVVAGVLIGLAAVATWERPSAAVVVLAFLVGGLVVFPVRAEYLGESSGEEADCTGYAPLAQAVTLGADERASIAFDWRCTNAALAHNPHIFRTR